MNLASGSFYFDVWCVDSLANLRSKKTEGVTFKSLVTVSRTRGFSRSMTPGASSSLSA